MLSRDQKATVLPETNVKYNDNHYLNDDDLAKGFNYFISIGETLLKSINPPGGA